MEPVVDLRPGEFDPLAINSVPTPMNPAAGATKVELLKPKLVQLYSPSEIHAYTPPPDQNLLGDYHLQRSALSVLAGMPGCGKSRSTLWLAIMGAIGSGNWFGMDIRSAFRTLILQNENGLARLHRDFQQLDAPVDLDDHVRISSPPIYGLALQNAMFRAELIAQVKDFAPDVIIVDPWNACVRDSMEKDFQEALARIREIAAASPRDAAVLILHHLRKPKSDDRHRGRNLTHLLAGSYVLVSVARSVLVMQSASDDVEDQRVVMTAAKNNDGQLGPRTAWERRNNLFVPVTDFDWDAFDNGTSKAREPKVQLEHIVKLFENGSRTLALSRAAEELQSIAKVGRSAAYEALKVTGRFAEVLEKEPSTQLLRMRTC